MGRQVTTPSGLPTPGTLRRYGLSVAAWRREYARTKGGKCPVCGLKKRLVIDHEHVPGWKRMPAKERAKYVRGLVCINCNHYILTRTATPAKLRAAAAYLEEYDGTR